ncbi:hypothetical protein LQZ18_17010 [Lachnospiraceae bacterium ZAX-1]
MSILKFLLYVIVSIIFSKLFLDSSAMGMVAIFSILNYAAVVSKKDDIGKKVPRLAYGILLAVCLLGITLIVVGNNLIHLDGLVILGAILFSPTIAVLIIVQVLNIFGYLKSKLKLNRK